MSTPADRLRAARKAAGYRTATDAAKAMGAHRATYIGHENGNRGFANDAARYADFFGVNLDWILRNRGAMKGKADPLLDKIRQLPPEKQQEALDYLDYLASRSQK